MKRALFATLFAAAALLLLAGPAGAVIKVQKGMAGIRLNMTKQQVRDARGAPRRIRHGSNDFGPYAEYRYRGRIIVTFQGNRRVTAITTSGRRERTRRGIGVGSTETALRAKVRVTSCETFAGIRSCQVGKSLGGHRVTAFIFNRHGRVKRVTVGFVID